MLGGVSNCRALTGNPTRSRITCVGLCKGRPVHEGTPRADDQCGLVPIRDQPQQTSTQARVPWMQERLSVISQLSDCTPTLCTPLRLAHVVLGTRLQPEHIIEPLRQVGQAFQLHDIEPNTISRVSEDFSRQNKAGRSDMA